VDEAVSPVLKASDELPVVIAKSGVRGTLTDTDPVDWPEVLAESTTFNVTE